MTIKIFVGTSPNGEDAEAQAVLEYTLRKNTKEELDIRWMKISNNPSSPFYGWNYAGFSTPFTPFRWCIPELCCFKGKAIYMDVDTICLADIAELYNQDMQDKAILVQNMETVKPIRTCVSLWDCSKIKSFAPQFCTIAVMKRQRDANGRLGNILRMNIDKVGKFQGKWNCVDLKSSSLDDPDLKVIHCSSIAHQPHQTHTVKRISYHWYDGYRFPHWRPELIELFDKLLIEAILAGYRPLDYVNDPFGYVKYKVKSYKNARVKGYA